MIIMISRYCTDPARRKHIDIAPNYDEFELECSPDLADKRIL
jgi:hypothetical protein